MSNPLRALCWESVAQLRGRWWWILPLILFFPAFFCFAHTPQAHVRTWDWPWPAAPMVPGAEFACLALNLIVVVSTVARLLPLPNREYTLPVPTSQLILAQIVPGACLCALAHLLVAFVLNWTYNPGWPYVGPALWYVLAFTLIRVVAWCWRGRDLAQLWTGLVAAFLVMIWGLGHYSGLPNGSHWESLLSNSSQQQALTRLVKERFGESSLPYFAAGEVSSSELLTWCALLGICWCILSWGVDRDRHGWSLSKVYSAAQRSLVRQQMSAQLHTGRSRQPGFRSPVTAMLWSEMRQDGWLVPVAITMFYLLVVVVHSGALVLSPRYRADGQNYQVLVAFGVGLSLLYFFLPLFIAFTTSHGQRSQKGLLLPSHLSALPVSDAALALVVILRSFVTMLVGQIGLLLAVTFGMLAHWGLTSLLPNAVSFNPAQLVEGPGWDWYGFGSYLFVWTLIAWLVTGLAYAAALSGRLWACLAPPFAVLGTLFLTVIAEGHAVDRPFLFSLGLVLSVLMIWAAFQVFLLRLLTWKWLPLLAAVIIGTISTLKFYVFARVVPNDSPLAPQVLAIIISTGILSMLPLILPPLAVYWNRHR